MTNLELSQSLGFNYDIVGVTFRTGIEMHGYTYFKVTGFRMGAKRDKIETFDDKHGITHNSAYFLKKKCIKVS